MKVDATLWYETPGAMPTMRRYGSIAEVVGDFTDMVKWSDGTPPVGLVYDRNNHDYPTHELSVSPRGAVRLTRVPA